MLNTLMKSAKDANIRTVVLGAIVVVSGLAAMGRSSPLDLNRKIYGKLQFGTRFRIRNCLVWYIYRNQFH